MTREETIDSLNAIREKFLRRYGEETVINIPIDGDDMQALDMAIKALEILPKYKDAYNKGWDDGAKATYEHMKMCEEEQEPQDSDHKCHTCKHYTSGEHDGSCGSYICKEYSDWESEVEQ